MPDPAIILTCEHAVNTVPTAWQPLFRDAADLLDSHRGWDPGALELARRLAAALAAPCHAAQVTRLLIDHNRSPHNPSLWSNISRELPAAEKMCLVDEYYAPFRRQVADWIAAQHAGGKPVLQLSVHSFTPVLDGRVRPVDIGLLYDPGRPEEASFAACWKAQLDNALPGLRVRRNVPYRGVSDSHLSGYRKAYKSRDYIGLELEVNQKLVGAGKEWPVLQRTIATTLAAALQDVGIDE